MSDTVKDAKGRTVEVREVVGSALSRLTRAAGAAFGDNVWSGATMARASILSVDGKPTPPLPTTMEQIDAMWDFVDAEAASAASTWLIARQAAVMDDAKNSSGHAVSGTDSGS